MNYWLFFLNPGLFIVWANMDDIHQACSLVSKILKTHFFMAVGSQANVGGLHPGFVPFSPILSSVGVY
ncbi:hypothetical protein CM15mP5_3910 [bacterium]|nr:MAG: hypothetical protein CM15mP5_3910 [bacterium]